ncbi:ABC transporter ATP-binding protein [Paracoccus onubensis]|uniref:ABC transporter ATP-binding protein n=1 Tax=Paracoccus onubensis TaxID=1675788 RepID=UPI00272F9F20|nr:ABC transporter ATP-binding protein [Paracoccus onubensis]MDP0930306.1 ABC transporter ATP-binding protein [Paracoccus onubensis]
MNATNATNPRDRKSEEQDAFLAIDGLQVKYGQTIALHDFDLHIKTGEFFCLLGPSGCGKSTLLGAIAGFIPTSKGRIHLDRTDITRLSQQQREIGIVFQSYALFPHMTAAENIAYGLKVRQMATSAIDARVSELLALVKLHDKGGRLPRQLSGGEQQRVAIARALAISPRLMLLDEPLSNLDARLRDEMRVELKRIQSATGVTTVFVTHDQEEAFGLGDRVAVLNHGRLEQLGTPEEIYRQPRTDFVAGFIGRANRLQGAMELAGDVPVFRTGNQTFVIKAAVPQQGGGPLTLLLRPEELTIGDSAKVNRLCGRVIDILYSGQTISVRVATDCGEFEALRMSDGQSVPAVGDEIEIGWDADAGHLLPGVTERAP